MNPTSVLKLLLASLVLNSTLGLNNFSPRSLATTLISKLNFHSLGKIAKSEEKPVKYLGKVVDRIVRKGIHLGYIQSTKRALSILQYVLTKKPIGVNFKKKLNKKKFNYKELLKIIMKKSDKTIIETLEYPDRKTASFYKLVCSDDEKDPEEQISKSNKKKKKLAKNNKKSKIKQKSIKKHKGKLSAREILRNELKKVYGIIAIQTVHRIIIAWIELEYSTKKEKKYLKMIFKESKSKVNKKKISKAGINEFDNILSEIEGNIVQQFGCRVYERSQKQVDKERGEELKSAQRWEIKTRNMMIKEIVEDWEQKHEKNLKNAKR